MSCLKIWPKSRASKIGQHKNVAPINLTKSKPTRGCPDEKNIPYEDMDFSKKVSKVTDFTW